MKLEGKIIVAQPIQSGVSKNGDKISFWKFPANTLKKSLFQ
mgnify:CR=1 FL=1